jgi:hypothetical protein
MGFDAGLVVPGDINNSPAINRLINYGSDMPLYGSALSEQDYQTSDRLGSIYHKLSLEGRLTP